MLSVVEADRLGGDYGIQRVIRVRQGRQDMGRCTFNLVIAHHFASNVVLGKVDFCPLYHTADEDIEKSK
jgi:hypothetical protein